MIGKTISHYKILENLGEGGMGVVYKAEDTKLKRTVALKFISPETMGKEESKTRFLREAQAVAALDHPNICTIYEINEAKGQTFLAMSYIKGLSLKKKIRLSPLSLEEAVDIALQVTEGLQEAHEKGIVHRDIKSSNIMITEKGQAKIMDFGLAKLTERTEITKTATIMGTVAYMSPEQALGEKIDQRADIWSLGVVIYEMLTGQLPFQAEHAQVILHSILEKDPKPVTSRRSGIPLEFEAIVKKCLEKDPTGRYQTAADLRADLKRLRREVTSGQIVVPTTAVAPRPFPRILKRVVIPVGVVLIALLFLLIIPSTRRGIESWVGFEIIPTEKRLAILPFTLVGGEESDRAFCYGLAEILISKISRLEQFQRKLWVLPAHEVYEYEITSPSRARRVFRINLALIGTFRRLGDMFTLDLMLVDTENLNQVKSESIKDHIANISTLQEDVVINLAEMLGIEMQQHMHRIVTAGGTTIPGAFESYIKGLGSIPGDKKEGNLDAAIGLFKQAIEKDPHYALAYAGLGKAYWKKYTATKDAAWIEKSKSSLNRAIEISDNLVAAYTMRGVIYGGTGRNEDAIKEFQQALQIDPKDYKALRELAEVYENLGRLEEAEKTLKKFIDLKPSYWVGYSLLGYVYYRQGRYEEAKKMYLKSTKLMIENVNDYNNLMAIYYYLGQFELAENAFEKSIAIKPDEVTYSNMGALYFYQHRYADALAMYEKAIELGGNSFRIWANLADSYRYTPGYKERAPEAYQRAIELAKEELKLNPGNAAYRSGLAVFYATIGDSQKALDEISKAKNLAPNDVPILFNSILVFELINQRDKALQALQEYMRLGGSMEEIQDNPDLSGLRTDPIYQDLVRGKKSNRSDSSSKNK